VFDRVRAYEAEMGQGGAERERGMDFREAVREGCEDGDSDAETMVL